MTEEKEQPKEELSNATLLGLLGTQEAVNEFKRFRDKENQRKIRRDIEYQVEDILADQLKAENEKAIENINKVYRRAWALACKALGFDEAEFPSKY